MGNVFLERVAYFRKRASLGDYQPFNPANNTINAAAGAGAGTTIGGLLGAGAGGLIGAIKDPGTDENGERNSRIGGALKGMGIGALAGGVLGGVGGGVVGRYGPEIMADGIANDHMIQGGNALTRRIYKDIVRNKVQGLTMDQVQGKAPVPETSARDVISQGLQSVSNAAREGAPQATEKLNSILRSLGF